MQSLCAVLSDNRLVEEIDISDNKIPDKSLKVLLALLYKNIKIKKIKYTLNEDENIERRLKFREYMQTPQRSFIDLNDHHHEVPLWQKIVFPIWIWKTFIHAKHEAFRFKYDANKLNKIESKLMFSIGIVLYFTTVVYFGIMFGFPFAYIRGEECGSGFPPSIFYSYLVYAIVTGVYEVYAVIKIQKEINDSQILSFNRWHVVELFMGQIARFDTFLDCCFLVLLIQCNMWKYAIPVALFIASMLCYPVYQIFKLCKVNDNLAHTQKFLERNCQLAFIRENMLLATVLDSFALNNAVEIFGR